MKELALLLRNADGENVLEGDGRFLRRVNANRGNGEERRSEGEGVGPR